jgi:hypothetical protein
VVEGYFSSPKHCRSKKRELGGMVKSLATELEGQILRLQSRNLNRSGMTEVVE